MLASKQFLAGKASVAPRTVNVARPIGRATLQVTCGLKEVRDRIASVKNTQKITEAMKLVAAAKVRRAQAAVINGRPFSENLVKVLFGINQRLRMEDVDSPLTSVRPVKTVMLVVLTGDRGLCGGYNNFILKKAEARSRELNALGVKVQLVLVGRKGIQYFSRRPQYTIAKSFALGSAPTTKDAQAIADELFSSFISSTVDKVELVFTKFVSLIASQPTIQTLLPMTPMGMLCDVDGKCVDATEDEIFRLTTKSGNLVIETEKTTIATEDLDPALIFEQEPAQILDSLLPLYMNSCLLRCLQEALASELAARMNAMSNASDNAKEIRKAMSIKYNRARQAKITAEISEIVAGAGAAR
ncbi:MAG: hypothetical protein WDW38_010631 [Sanguina aurantia]